jgi:hypothetical protein
LIAILRLRDVMVDRLVDYDVIAKVQDTDVKKRIAAVLFTGLRDRQMIAVPNNR